MRDHGDQITVLSVGKKEVGKWEKLGDRFNSW